MKYFAYLGLVMAIATEFGKAMADGKVTKGEWIDIIFNVGDKATEQFIGLDLDPFRPVAEEVKAQLAEGQASIVGLLMAIAGALESKGLDYRFDIPGNEKK